MTEFLKLEIDIYKRLLIYFQIAESCYVIFNFLTSGLDFVSSQAQSVLGYPKEDVSVGLLMANIHPDDREWFLACQSTAGVFVMGLPPEKQLKYKMRFDYRMKRADGSYFRVMQQVVVIQNDDEHIYRTLIVFSDITHLKHEGKPVMSYIGIDGEPSYMNVEVGREPAAESEKLSRREREVLFLMTEGKVSKEIADILGISKSTVDSHRKNMLSKTSTTSSASLVNKAVREGWL